MKIFGSTYKERVEYQLTEWVKGNSIHNSIDGECCPDFSCCQNRFKANNEERKIFAEAIRLGRVDITHALLMSYLGKSIAENFSDKNITILDGETEKIITEN